MISSSKCCLIIPSGINGVFICPICHTIVFVKYAKLYVILSARDNKLNYSFYDESHRSFNKEPQCSQVFIMSDMIGATLKPGIWNQNRKPEPESGTGIWKTKWERPKKASSLNPKYNVA